MARKFLTPIDLNKLELQNAVIQNLASAPSSPSVGQVYFDTTLGYLRSWNGTAWLNASIGADGAQGTQGIQGIQGTQGLQGNDGMQGIQGEQGPQGDQGIQGNDGMQGLQGNDGMQGAQGEQGIQGIQGQNAGILSVTGNLSVDGDGVLSLNESGIASDLASGSNYITNSDSTLNVDLSSLESQLSTDGFVKNNDSSITVGGSGDFTVNASANIVLEPGSGDHVYLGSVGANNEVATVSDVTNLAFIQSVNGPLSTSGSQLNLNYGAGLGLSGSDLVVNTDNTLTTSAGGSENQLGVNAGVGLTKDSNGYIAVNVGSGLDVNGTTGAVEVDTTTIATKSYVDSVAQGLNVKNSVRVASSAAVTSLTSVTAVDGVTLADGDRVLLKDQSISIDNGIYSYTLSTTTLARATDEQTPAKGDFVFVESGDTNAKTGWILNADIVTWTQFSAAGEYTAGTNISISGNTIAVQDAPTFHNTTLTSGSSISVPSSSSNLIYGSLGTPFVAFSTDVNAALGTLAVGTLVTIPAGLTGAGTYAITAQSDPVGFSAPYVTYTLSDPGSVLGGVWGGGGSFIPTGYTITVGSLTSVSATEISYLSGVTSAIQTQLNAKGTVNKYAATITGDAVTLSFPITHGLGSADAEVSVYDSTGAKVETDVAINSTTATIGFAVAPDSGVTYRVVVTA